MDYRFAIRCWQDKAGSENAKANVFVGSTKVLTEVEITATSADSPQVIAWESTGLTDPKNDTTFDVKVVLANEYYVDADTDRNIWINGFGYITKAADGAYKQSVFNSENPPVKTGENTITDFTDWLNYESSIVPTAVTGDQIASDWWSGRGDTSFYYIPVWGGDDTGVTMTMPITINTCKPAE